MLDTGTSAAVRYVAIAESALALIRDLAADTQDAG
jgi:hypothetical protein